MGLPLLHFNSMIGLGLVPAIDDAIARFRSAQATRYLIHLAPGAQPAELEPWMLARGLRPAAAWVRVVRGSEPLSETAPDHSTVEAVST